MQTVNILETDGALSSLVEAIERGQTSEIIIARNGKPAAKLVPIDCAIPLSKRIGIAKALFEIPDTIDTHNGEVLVEPMSLITHDSLVALYSETIIKI